MTVSRRKFLRGSSVVGLAAIVPLASKSTNAKEAALMPAPSFASQHEALDRLTNELFVEQINTQFHVQVSALDLQHLQLVKVSNRRLSEGETFDVIFLGQKEKQFKQGTYLVSHIRTGSFPLFIVPIGMDSKGAYYQAVFNRL